jgi:putative NADH-flavin reductase
MSKAPVLLIGSTGPTGRQILAMAAAVGVPVRAMVRDPDRLPLDQRCGAEVVRGDVLDAVSLRQAVAGTSAVVSALGTPLLLRQVTMLSMGTRQLVAAMSAAGVGRLLCITGMGAGDSLGHGGFLYDRILLPALLGRIYADKNRQEDVVRDSPLDWVLVRPARLIDAPSKGSFRCITQFAPGDRMTTIARADVARFMVDELQRPRHHRASVNLTD